MTAKLYYTNGRGLSEVIRIALGAAEIKVYWGIGIRIPREKGKEMKKKREI